MFYVSVWNRLNDLVLRFRTKQKSWKQQSPHVGVFAERCSGCGADSPVIRGTPAATVQTSAARQLHPAGRVLFVHLCTGAAHKHGVASRWPDAGKTIRRSAKLLCRGGLKLSPKTQMRIFQVWPPRISLRIFPPVKYEDHIFKWSSLDASLCFRASSNLNVWISTRVQNITTFCKNQIK